MQVTHTGCYLHSIQDGQQSFSLEATKVVMTAGYEEYLPIADKLYNKHIETLKREGPIP